MVRLGSPRNGPYRRRHTAAIREAYTGLCRADLYRRKNISVRLVLDMSSGKRVLVGPIGCNDFRLPDPGLMASQMRRGRSLKCSSSVVRYWAGRKAMAP